MKPHALNAFLVPLLIGMASFIHSLTGCGNNSPSDKPSVQINNSDKYKIANNYTFNTTQKNNNNTEIIDDNDEDDDKIDVPNPIENICKIAPNSLACICGKQPDSKTCFCLSHPHSRKCLVSEKMLFCEHYCSNPKQYFQDMLQHYSSADCDNDGLPNQDEVHTRTNICSIDSDRDGLSDKFEVDHHINPLSTDSDDDGVPDADEIKFGLDPNNPYTFAGKNDKDFWAVTACSILAPDDDWYSKNNHVFSNLAGDWLFTLPFATLYHNIPLLPSSHNDYAALAFFNHPVKNYAGAILSLPPKPYVDDAKDALYQATEDLKKVVKIRQQSYKSVRKTHDNYFYQSAEFVVSLPRTTLNNVRDDIAFALHDHSISDFNYSPPNTTSKKSYFNFKIHMTAVYRVLNGDKRQVIILFTTIPFVEWGVDEITQFQIEDIVGTTGLSQKTDTSENICYSFNITSRRPIADFYFVLDESDSMRVHNTALSNITEKFWHMLSLTDIDYRIGVTNIEYDSFSVNPNAYIRNGLIMSPWSRSPDIFRKNVSSIIHGRGSVEEGLRIAKDGIIYMRSPEADADYRIRKNASLILIWITDEEELSFKNGITGVKEQELNKYISFYQKNATCFAIATKTCTSYRRVAQATGGSYADLDGNNLEYTIQKIVDAAVGITSPFRLASIPIASTIQVIKDNKIVPRSRKNGFDYNYSTNSISFYGNARPTKDDIDNSKPIVISYRYYNLNRKPPL